MKNLTFVLVVALLSVVFAGCLMGTPAVGPVPLSDGSVDPLQGTPCTAGAIQACDYPCWSAAVRVCPAETMRWTRCTPDELHGIDTCAPAPCTGPAVCSTICGNSGLRSCDLATGILGACDPIFPPGEICDAGVLPADAGTDAGPDDLGPPDLGPTDAGPPDLGPVDAGPDDLGPPDLGPPVVIDAGVDAGPLMCGGCTDRDALRVCETNCGFAGGQTCGECLNGLCCHPLAPSLETCALADPICLSSGTDAGPVVVDAGAGIDAGTDAGPPDLGPPDLGPPDLGPPDLGPVDAGPPDGGPVDAGPPDMGPVDAGPSDMGPTDLGPPDLGPTDAGPPDLGPTDAGMDSGPICTPTGVERCGNGVDEDCNGSDMVCPPGVTSSGAYIVLNDTTTTMWCAASETVEPWCWDNTGPRVEDYEHFGPPPLLIPVGAGNLELNGSVINGTVDCRFGASRYAAYPSSRITSATVGADSETIGVRVFINAVEVPAFICWDTPTSTRTDPNFKRIQFVATTNPALFARGCSPGTGS